MKCHDPQCGTENADGATFCAACGGRLVASDGDGVPVDEKTSRICPACGRVNAAEARFCGKCGCPLRAKESEVVTQIADARIAAPALPTRDVDPEATVMPAGHHGSWNLTEPTEAPDPVSPPPAYSDDRTARAPARSSPARALGPMFFVAIGIVAVVAGSVGAWLFLVDAPAPAGKTAPSQEVAAQAPVFIPPPPAATVEAPPSAPAAVVVAAEPAAPQEAASRPFQSLETPAPAPPPATVREPLRPPPVTIQEPSRQDDSRIKADRARRREEARLAREAAAQQAREAALRNAEASAAANTPRSPEEQCASQGGFLAKSSCEARLCQTSEWMFHSFCVKRRALEEQKRQGSSSGGSGY